MGKRHFDLSGTRVAANVLATVTGATAASYFGVAGTLTGTVVMSVASSAGTTIYQHYLKRGREKVREISPVVSPRTRVLHGGAVEVWQAGDPGADERADDGLGQATPSAEGAFPEVSGAFPTVSGGFPAVPGSHGASRRKRLHWRQVSWQEIGWRRVAVAAAVTLVLAVVVISAIELAVGRPLGAIVRGQRASGTSIGSVFGSQHSSGRPQSPSGPGSSAPAQAPARPANTTGPAPAGSHPAPAPSPVPTAPASSPAGRSGGGTGNGASPAGIP